MNIRQAKQIKLTSLLNRLGYKPLYIRKNEYWYFSPFRSENEPSFCINKEKNLWNDFGLSKGGSVVDFIQIYKNISISDSLKFLEKETRDLFNFDIAENEISKLKISKITNYKVLDLKDGTLINYLLSRNLNIDICKIHLKQINYMINNRFYFGVGFKSENGFEIRNRYFKGCVGSKSISFIKGERQNQLSIFEGFIDFLSALSFYKVNKFKTDVIVLNSISLLKRVNFESYEKLYLFLDNDVVGKQAVSEISSNYKNPIINKSLEYKGFKDFNAFLMSEESKNSFSFDAKNVMEQSGMTIKGENVNANK